jgi:hypothetical protein
LVRKAIRVPKDLLVLLVLLGLPVPQGIRVRLDLLV